VPVFAISNWYLFTGWRCSFRQCKQPPPQVKCRNMIRELTDDSRQNLADTNGSRLQIVHDSS
jgi:hypothetical protein